MPARCLTGQSGPSKKEANYNENNSQIDSYLSTRCPDMCQKGSEGRGALLMEIQRRERVVLVAPAHGGQVGVFTLELFKVGFFSLVARGGKVGAFLSLFCPTHWVRLISFWSSSFLVITENNPVNHKSLESETLQKSPFGDASHFPTIIIINHSKQFNCQEKIFYRG